jgi:hypothetical protein
MSWIVPGANPANTTPYMIVSDRNSSGTNLVITATTQATAQTLTSVVLSTDYVSNLSIFGNFTITSSSNTQANVSYFVQSLINGVFANVGFIFKSSLAGVGHSMACPIVVGTTNTPATNVTLYLKAFASTASVFTVNPAQIVAIGNISQD